MFLGRGTNRIHSELSQIHAAGIEIGLDDFGTGFAPLTHLKTLPIDRLKIDRSFVQELETDAASAAIIDGIIRIAHSLGLLVTAEGVETEGQLSALLRLKCDHAQGYLFAKPMASSEVDNYLNRFFVCQTKLAI